MGQAKKRGTFEQRRQLAEARNEMIARHIADSKNLTLKGLVNKHGLQRVACSLLATGMINHITPPEPEKSLLVLPPRYGRK